MVDVYILRNVSLNEEIVNQRASSLHTSIKEHVLSYKVKEDRIRSLLAYEKLVELLNKDIELKFNKYGKPYVDDKYFSISHSGEYIVLAIGFEEVGIDIQKIVVKDNSKLVARYFKDDEKEYVNSSEDKSLAFTKIWARKEAYIKYLGKGLSLPLASFSTLKDKNIKDISCPNGYCLSLYSKDNDIKVINERIIYLAGGCFWGIEAYFKQIRGVISTKVGYANGNKANPKYEELKLGLASHAETLELRYDANIVSLTKILEFFLRVVDPYSINHQGEDYGLQYRSGVYFVYPSDEKIIRDYFASKLRDDYKIEVKELDNFYEAEEYHQDYLNKNPHGYCHIDFNKLKDDEKKST